MPTTTVRQMVVRGDEVPRLHPQFLRAAGDGTLPARLIGAHDAISARLGEQAGFDGIWASSLEISASHAVPDDAGALTLDDLAERVREIARAVSIPVLVDADLGFDDVGDTVRVLESCGAAGLVLEDQLFPKINSLKAAGHRLRAASQFCDELRLALACRRSPAFTIVARVESLVAGEPVEAALDRCRAYIDAGATAAIIHSKHPSGEDVLECLSRLTGTAPVGVIPTAYYHCSARRLRAAGASFVIYANYGMRAKVRALHRVFETIWTSGSAESIEGEVAGLDEVFELQAPTQARTE